jgi:hypothetical protein
MKKLIVLVFSIVLFGSCSSEKVLSEKLKYDWNINYLENDDNNISFSPIEDYQYVNEKSNNISIEELKYENLIASSNKIFLNNKKQFVSLSRKVEELKESNSDCDNIIFKNGDELSAKVIEITTGVVKYKRCDNLEGPLISVSKKEILMIRYKNGTKELFKENTQSSFESANEKTVLKKTEPAAIISFITGLVGGLLPVSGLGLMLVILALIFSLMGLTRISKEPDKLKGKGFAIAGFVLGVLSTIGILSTL